MRAAILLVPALVACSAAKADVGRDAWLQASGGQFVRGAMPVATDGPAVSVVHLATNTVRAGTIEKPLDGALEPGSTACAIGLRGDRGYWIVPAGVPGVEAPSFPTFETELAFADSLPDGAHDLVVRAVDENGHFGPESVSTLNTAPDGAPDGHLVVALTWDSEADLDMHVVDPTGAEVWRGNVSSAPPPLPGQPPDPNALANAGVLDFDSNAQCVIDGRRREDVVWKGVPVSGHYVVRVDTFSLCGAPAARWTVEALRDGASVGRAGGESGPTDTQFSHDRGAGVLALEFDVP